MLPDGGEAERALERAAQVGQDVAEQVAGDDDVELLRIEHHARGQRVDVLVPDASPPGSPCATAATTSSQKTMEWLSAFDLVALTMSVRLRFIARSNA